MSNRRNHFMKKDMLNSQLAALEEPSEDEVFDPRHDIQSPNRNPVKGVVVVDIDDTKENIVEKALSGLKKVCNGL
jgi:gluconate kinase